MIDLLLVRSFFAIKESRSHLEYKIAKGALFSYGDNVTHLK